MARKKFQWSRDEENPEGEFHFTERRSWSDRDRDNKRLVALGKALVRLKPSVLGEIQLSVPVAEAVAEARRLRNKGNVKGGMRRQMLLLTTRLREEDEEVIANLISDLSEMVNLQL